MNPVAFVVGEALSIGHGLVQPAVNLGLQEFRTSLGWNDLAIERGQAYNQQWISSDPGRITLTPLGARSFSPVKFNIAQAIQAYNQQPWHRFAEDSAEGRGMRSVLTEQLKFNGVNIDTVQLADGALQSHTDAASMGNQLALQWRRLIDFSSAAPALPAVMHDYYRSLAFPLDERPVSERELFYNLQRAQYRRPEDRRQLLAPFARWSAIDALRMREADIVNPEVYRSLMQAAGLVRDDDHAFFRTLNRVEPTQMALALLLRGRIGPDEANRLLALNGVTTQRGRDAVLRSRFLLPDVATLQGWNVRNLWSDELQRRYDLDDGFQASPVAVFFSRIQGAGPPAEAEPGQPDGETDWLKLGYRASRPLPGFGEAAEMQWRLRPDPANPGLSVDGVTEPWTEANTRDVLRMRGYTEPVINRMIGVVHVPLNIRLINHVLSPLATHPDVAAAAQAALGHPTDWIESAMLDHGFAPPLAKIAAAGILAQADDRANAEKLAHEKRQRDENLKVAADLYERGLIDGANFRQRYGNKFVTPEMADIELRLIDAALTMRIHDVKIKALRTAFMDGKLAPAQIGNEIAALGVSAERTAQYAEEWSWERAERTKILATGEILAALKTGLLSPSAASARLVNLGWNAPDALIEIAQVQHSLQMAAAHQADSAATHQAAQAAKAHAEQIKEEKAAALAAAKATKEKLAQEKLALKTGEGEVKALSAAELKTAKEVANAVHEKLLAQSEYYAKVHAANEVYAKAQAKGDTEKMAAEIDKEIAAHQKYLLDQIKLFEQNPEISNVLGPIDTEQAPGPAPGPGISPPAGATPAAAPGATGAAGGTGGPTGP